MPKNLIKQSAALTGFVLLGLAFTGCSTDSGLGAAAAGTGEGVAAGASAAVWQEALADMDPVKLIFQSNAASELSPLGEAEVNFKALVEEYSGGNIEIEIAWNHSIAPPLDVDEALLDGRIDMSRLLTGSQPQDFPVSNEMPTTTLVRDSRPAVGEMALKGSLIETAWGTPELIAELEGQGLTVIVPALSGGGSPVVACNSPREDLRGAQVRVAGTHMHRQIEALGGVPVSMSFADVYEGLQRGVIDCTSGGIATVAEFSWLEQAPNVIIPAGETAFVGGNAPILAGPSFSRLPLAAQQLLFDMTYKTFVPASLDNELSWLSYSLGKGTFTELSKDESDKLSNANQELIRDFYGSNLVDGTSFEKRINDAKADWVALLEDTDAAKVGLKDFHAWYEGEPDLSAFVDHVTKTVQGYRPGA
ncbi:TRAP transporter substrate-binding protein [Arthrobacter sp. B6]|uniref:TRAP transporter substrate-binding protein n=1 Tax=Arthrobacter sp. B6 TaxID=1570137 RepID=UPI00082BCA09|nr:hypothetical protein [Arthrobacter sp. B6]